MSPDLDLFRDGRLGFELRKPASWKFLPPAWSPLERAKRNLESDDFFRLAGRPFCCAVREHGVRGVAYPTLQVVMRPFPAPSLQSLPALLETVIEQTAKLHETLEVEVRTPNSILAGYPAIGYQGRFEFLQVEGGIETKVGARSRSQVVFARGLAFTVALSGSDNPNYYDESEFDSILASIRIR